MGGGLFAATEAKGTHCEVYCSSSSSSSSRSGT